MSRPLSNPPFFHLSDPTEEATLNEVARLIGCEPWMLFAIIWSESKWSPIVKNPFGSARGLIQFTDATAQRMGYLNSEKLVANNPDRITQLRGPVLKYFRDMWKVERNNFVDMVSCLFYPKYRKTPSKRLPEAVIKVNPGIDSVATYALKIEREYNRWKSRGLKVKKWSK
jgi:hypothetical protein